MRERVGMSSHPPVAPSGAREEEPMEHLQCPICTETYSDPVIVSCCGNSYCRGCLDGALAVRDSCPMCRTPLLGGVDTVGPNRALQKLAEHLGDSRPLPGRGGGGAGGPGGGGAGGLPSAYSVWVRLVLRFGAAGRSFLVACRKAQLWGPNLRVALYVAGLTVLMIFLRVQEEDYARQEAEYALRLAGARPGDPEAAARAAGVRYAYRRMGPGGVVEEVPLGAAARLQGSLRAHTPINADAVAGAVEQGAVAAAHLVSPPGVDRSRGGGGSGKGGGGGGGADRLRGGGGAGYVPLAQRLGVAGRGGEVGPLIEAAASMGTAAVKKKKKKARLN